MGNVAELRTAPGFNLTLLECKCAAHAALWRQPAVLILPYWNVNGTGRNGGIYVVCVLILPYWNVNLVRRKDDLPYD